jgi:hypothetical protein
MLAAWFRRTGRGSPFPEHGQRDSLVRLGREAVLQHVFGPPFGMVVHDIVCLPISRTKRNLM